QRTARTSSRVSPLGADRRCADLGVFGGGMGQTKWHRCLNWLEAWWLFAAIATITIQSFAAYVTHRLFHSSSWFWRVHRVHHFDTAVDVSTGSANDPKQTFVVGSVRTKDIAGTSEQGWQR